MAHIKSQSISHSIGGGWATDYGQTLYSAPDGGHLRLPWLNEAQNVQFGFDGSVKKFTGTSTLNSTPLYNRITGDTSLQNVYDYWKIGTAGTPSQYIVAKVGTQIAATSTTSFSIISPGSLSFSANTPSHFTTFNDLLIIGNSNGPASWDQATFQALAGTPPVFSFSTPHKGRHWAAGVATAPSRVYYSAVGNPEDWTGAGSGSIDIDPGDGDKITGLLSWKNELWVFKGPYKLSIHRITGSSPSDFARTTFVTGVSAAHQNVIFPFGDDFAFWSPRGTCHSLKATDTYGDYAQAFLNYPILSWCRAANDNGATIHQNMVITTSHYWQAGSDPLGGFTLLAYRGPAGGLGGDVLFPNRLLMMDWRFIAQGEAYPRFSQWTMRNVQSLCYGIDLFSPAPSRILGGGSNGKVYRFGTNSFAHDDVGLRYQVSTPYVTYGSEYETKSPSDLSVNLDPKGSATVTVNWGGPYEAKQSSTVSQVGEALLDSFTLDTSTLGETGSRPSFLQEMSGDFRSIQYDFINDTSAVDVVMRGFNVVIAPNAPSTESSI